jgi:hypothetical protein
VDTGTVQTDELSAESVETTDLTVNGTVSGISPGFRTETELQNFVNTQSGAQKLVNAPLELGAVTSSITAMDIIAASQTAMNEIAGTQTAMDEVIISDTAVTEVQAVPSADSTFHQSALFGDALNTLDPAVATSGVGSITDVAASQTAMNEIVGSQTAMNEIVGSQTAMAEIADSQTAMAIVSDSATALGPFLSSPSVTNTLWSNDTGTEAFWNHNGDLGRNQFGLDSDSRFGGQSLFIECENISSSGDTVQWTVDLGNVSTITVAEKTVSARVERFEIVVNGNTLFTTSSNNTSFVERSVDVSGEGDGSTLEVGLQDSDVDGRETVVSDIVLS